MMNETLGKIHFFLTFIFFNGTFFLMHIVGMHGMPAAVSPTTPGSSTSTTRRSSG